MGVRCPLVGDRVGRGWGARLVRQACVCGAWITEARPRAGCAHAGGRRSGRRHPLHRPECTVTARADVREADVSQRRTQESAHGPRQYNYQ